MCLGLADDILVDRAVRLVMHAGSELPPQRAEESRCCNQRVATQMPFMVLGPDVLGDLSCKPFCQVLFGTGSLG